MDERMPRAKLPLIPQVNNVTQHGVYGMLTTRVML